MTAGLESRVGDHYMTGGSSGSHDPSHMKANDFLAHVREHHTPGSHHYKADADARAKAVHELHETYNAEQGRLLREVVQEFKGFKHKKNKDLYAKIKEAYEANDKEPLNTLQMEEHLKDLADAILPQLNYGVAGEKDKNYQALQAYIAALNPRESEEGQKLVNELYSAVKTGKGQKAARAMIEILKAHKTSNYLGQLEAALFNREDHDFRDAYAALIKKGVEDELGDAELRTHSLASDLEKAAKLYVAADYVGLAEEYKLKKPKMPKASHGSHAAH